MPIDLDMPSGLHKKNGAKSDIKRQTIMALQTRGTKTLISQNINAADIKAAYKQSYYGSFNFQQASSNQKNKSKNSRKSPMSRNNI